MPPALRFILGLACICSATGQWNYRLQEPCGRDVGSESVMMCGKNPCQLRKTKAVTGFPSVKSNSLFNIYDTAGPDLTIDMCMSRVGVYHSAQSALATDCSEICPVARDSSGTFTSDPIWCCGGLFSSNSCEFEEEMFDVDWTCPDCASLHPGECTAQTQSWACTTQGTGGVVQGTRVLLRYDTSIVNVGSERFTIGSRTDNGSNQDDKKFRDYISFEDSNCHSHTHLENFAEARLCSDADCKNVVASGTKLSFCILDSLVYGPTSDWACSGPEGGGTYTCEGKQGLSSGCADLYSTLTDGNWIDVTTVPRDATYFLEIAVGAGCRNKDHITCSKCTRATHISNKRSCEAETGCVWDTNERKCAPAEWCCMDTGLPEVWPNPQDAMNGRCGANPKCYLFPESDLKYYDNNIGVVEIYLPPFDEEKGHKDPCFCVDHCGDGTCNAEAKEDCTTCPKDCGNCPTETNGIDGSFNPVWCSDKIDNDGNGLTDCEDPACYNVGETVCGTCSDFIDNDRDGLIDCLDEDCFDDETCIESCTNTGEACVPLPGANKCCSDGKGCICNSLGEDCKCSDDIVIPPTVAPVMPSPAPVLRTPAPVTRTIAPVRLTPAPVTPTPAPVTRTPAPVTRTTASVTPTTAPVTRTTAPVSRTPASVTPTPAPVTRTPAPVTRTTAPVTPTTAPVTRTAAPVRRTPAPVAPTPSPVTRTPAPVTRTTAPVTPTTSPVTRATAPVGRTPAPVALTPPTGGIAVKGLVLFNADTDKELGSVSNGQTINLADFGNPKINFRALVSSDTKSVRFGLNTNADYRVENVAPYFMAGDKTATGNVLPWTDGYRVGKHTITIIAYSATGAQGIASTPPTNFNVTIIRAFSSDAVTGFSLVHSGSKSFIQKLKNGDVLDVGSLGSSISIRADTTPSIVGSVVFSLNGKDGFRPDSKPPYAIKGHIDGNYRSQSYNLGANTLRATPFTSAGGNGKAGSSLEITFTIEDSSRFRSSRVGGRKL